MTELSSMTARSSACQTEEAGDQDTLGVFRHCPSCKRLSAALKRHDMWKANVLQLEAAVQVSLSKREELDQVTMRLQKMSHVVAPLLRRESAKRWRSAGCQTSRSWLVELPPAQTLREASIAAEQRSQELSLQLERQCAESEELRQQVAALRDALGDREERLEMMEYELQESKNQVEDMKANLDASRKDVNYYLEQLKATKELYESVRTWRCFCENSCALRGALSERGADDRGNLCAEG